MTADTIITQPLSGEWEFRNAAETAWHPATVPGGVHADLHRAGLIPDPFFADHERQLEWIGDATWEYRRTFSAGAALLESGHVALVCEGLDTLATVLLNGREVARTDSMHLAYRWEVKPLLRAGLNELVVRFDPPMPYIAARTHRHRIDDGAAFGGSIIRKQHSSLSWDWAPFLPVCGIFRDLRLEAGRASRLASVRVDQQHNSDGSVTLTLHPEIEGAATGFTVIAEISLNGVSVASFANQAAQIKQPQLWWPNGHGAQPLYTVRVELRDANGQQCDTWQRRIGLRRIELVREPDAWGESFYFRVNGVAIYAKGANWIPPHAFAGCAPRATYEHLLRDSAAVHMNMIRVWGGGNYETDDFYDLCDEFGLLVWQDFMFSCSLYPGWPEFLELVRHEAEHQVRRLRHHACLALWCGNNEIEHFIEHIKKSSERETTFLKLFFDLLPKAVRGGDPRAIYWPGSPHNPKGWDQGPSVESGGDGHAYWETFDAFVTAEAATDRQFHFWSEFGMQSFCSEESMATFLSPEQGNLFHPAFTNHQKRRGMNSLLLKMIGEQYLAPSELAGWIYLSQVNQARLMTLAIEHQRCGRPRCMGSLFWQLNETWPGVSWASLEFGGRWKALHFHLRRLFAPVLLVAKLNRTTKINKHGWDIATISGVEFHLVCDALTGWAGELAWEIIALADGSVLDSGRQAAACPTAGSALLHVLSAEILAAHPSTEVYVRARLLDGQQTLDDRTVYLRELKRLAFQRETIVPDIAAIEAGRWQVTLRSAQHHHAVQLRWRGSEAVRFEGNYFDLHAGQPRTVVLHTPPGLTAAAVKENLLVRSYADFVT
jgi:beta-mannosidase